MRNYLTLRRIERRGLVHAYIAAVYWRQVPALLALVAIVAGLTLSILQHWTWALITFGVFLLVALYGTHQRSVSRLAGQSLAGLIGMLQGGKDLQAEELKLLDLFLQYALQSPDLLSWVEREHGELRVMSIGLDLDLVSRDPREVIFEREKELPDEALDAQALLALLEQYRIDARDALGSGCIGVDS